jgi:hypothetical protein
MAVNRLTVHSLFMKLTDPIPDQLKKCSGLPVANRSIYHSWEVFLLDSGTVGV